MLCVGHNAGAAGREAWPSRAPRVTEDHLAGMLSATLRTAHRTGPRLWLHSLHIHCLIKAVEQEKVGDVAVSGSEFKSRFCQLRTSPIL